MKTLALLVLVAAFGGGTAPKLAVQATDPLTVRGTHFRAHEKMTVVAEIGPKTRKRVVAADAAGAFRVRFDLAVPANTHLALDARGSLGSRAHFGVDYGDAAPAAKS